MASNEFNNPELTAVLKTLSAFAPAVPTVARNPFTGRDGSRNVQQSSSRDQEYEPSDKLPSIPSPHQDTATNHAPIAHSMVSRPLPPSRGSNIAAAKPAGNAFDPSLITTWPAALKYVMKTVGQNESVQGKIRRMIQSQHDHEKKWWQGREALLEKQATRAEKKKRINEVLRSVGAPVDTTTKELPSAEENEKELKYYDAKVYKSSIDLAKAVDSELRGLNIPFFAVKHSLVASLEKDENPDTISRDELLALQRRMLELLENLCKE